MFFEIILFIVFYFPSIDPYIHSVVAGYILLNYPQWSVLLFIFNLMCFLFIFVFTSPYGLKLLQHRAHK